MLTNLKAEEKFAIPMRIYNLGLMIGEEKICRAAENVFFQYRYKKPKCVMLLITRLGNLISF
jgi:hypothetical protein